ncbi:hypothetical protein [Nitrosomonas sp.]|uniref:hypothetical protein n=1 Tax=Nitrosomonas sp. TaxID=42353 RepID=UPI00273126D0|nr:hypothetical protein [Nitrosomonas sp.]
MIRGSSTHTQEGQPVGAVARFWNNNGTIDDNAAIFLVGRITPNIGAFMEGTYDGVENKGVLDNSDIRFQIISKSPYDFCRLVYGINLNSSVRI